MPKVPVGYQTMPLAYHYCLPVACLWQVRVQSSPTVLCLAYTYERVAEELKGIKACKWNSEQFLVLQVVILQQSRDVTQSRDV
jgi:hypothetical protein